MKEGKYIKINIYFKKVSVLSEQSTCFETPLQGTKEVFFVNEGFAPFSLEDYSQHCIHLHPVAKVLLCNNLSE